MKAVVERFAWRQFAKQQVLSPTEATVGQTTFAELPSIAVPQSCPRCVHEAQGRKDVEPSCDNNKDGINQRLAQSTESHVTYRPRMTSSQPS